MAGLFLLMGSLGFTIANSTSLALEKLAVHASYAGGLMGVMQFLIAGIASFLMGRIGLDGSLNLIIMMTVFSFSGAVLLLLNSSDQSILKRLVKARSHFRSKYRSTSLISSGSSG